jgi:hypothetical protein
MAVIMAVIVLARLIVKLTPTPEDDTRLEKVINFLKHIGLNVKAILMVGCLSSLLFLESGCAPGQRTRPQHEFHRLAAGADGQTARPTEGTAVGTKYNSPTLHGR